MANSDLINVKVELPKEIISFLRQALHMFRNRTNDRGYDRATYLINAGDITYQELKRIKNYFDNLSDTRANTPEFFLNGGNMMAKWVNNVLDELRNRVNLKKQTQKDAGESNSFKSEPDEANDNKPAKIKKADIARLDTISQFNRNNIMNEEITRIKQLFKY